MGLALASKGKSPHQVLTERNHGRPANATLQVDKKPVPMRSFEWSHNDKYGDDKLPKPITGEQLRIKLKSNYRLHEILGKWISLGYIFSDVSLINEIYPEVPDDYEGLRSFISTLSSTGFQYIYLNFFGENLLRWENIRSRIRFVRKYFRDCGS